MDPLSIIASTVALVEFSRKLSHGLSILRDLSHVPDEIAALLDELQDLQNVLAAICVVIDQRLSIEGLVGCTDELKSLLVKTGNIFSMIAIHCGITIHQDLDSGRKDDTRSFATPVVLDPSTRFRWLKDRKKISAYRQRLKIVRLDIANHLASLNLIGSCSVLVELRDLASALRRLSIDQNLLQQSLKNLIPNAMQPDAEKENEQDPNFLYLDDKLGLKTLSAYSDAQPSVNSALHHLSSCSCSCHRVSTITTPGILRNVCGALTVKLQGISGITPTCDESVCSRSKRSSLKVNYRFPSWILDWRIDTLLSLSYPGGPQLSLSSTRILPNYCEIFWLAIQGNIPGIKDLFQRGLASPYDATSNYGYTALHYAIDYGHLELCDFLLKQGARNDILSFNNRSPSDIAYSKLCTSDLDLCHKDRIQLMFGEESWLEQEQFSVLHKIVMKLAKSKISLVDELRISTKEINTTDSDGRTPLSWAAELGN